MASYFNCIARLKQAAGRALSDDEVYDIFDRIDKTARNLREGRNTKESGYGPNVDTLIQDVALQANSDLIAEKRLQQQRAARQVTAIADRLDDWQSIKNAKLSPLEALMRLIVNRADGRSNVFSLEAKRIGVEINMKRGLVDTWSALGDDFFGFLQDTDKIKLLIREMRGEDTGDAMAKKGAEAWKKTTEQGRQQFNALGGNIGKLEDWGLPQHHSQERVARAGREAWIDAVMPALDRTKYVDDLGIPLGDTEVKAFLGEAYKSIATNGMNKVEPGQYRGNGARANRGSLERQIHFQSADAYMNYWAQFGEKTFPEILMGHVDGLARDIALVDRFGPNPETTYRTLRDTVAKTQAESGVMLADASKRASTAGDVAKELARIDSQWNVAAGHTLPVADMRIANGFKVMHALNVAGKLGSAVWASVFGDKVMMEAVAHVNNLPAFSRWRDEFFTAFSGEERKAALRRQGLMLEYMTSSMSRFGQDLGTTSLPNKMASAVMRLSGMNWINEMRRGSFGLSLMSALGDMLERKPLDKISEGDMHLLQSYGINGDDLALWKAAPKQDLGHGNVNGLTPDAIMAMTPEQVAQARPTLFPNGADAELAHQVKLESVEKLLGAINSESRYAIIEPGWRERAQMGANIQRGTWKGELLSAFWQFKSFPIAQFERMWDISASRPTNVSSAALMSSIVIMSTIAGAMMIQVQDALSGKDPRPVNDWKFWGAAFMKGGTLGIYGDFLYGTTQTRYGTGPLEVAAGPTIGAALDTMTSTMQAIKAKSEGKETHLMAKYLNIAKGFVPGNNLWYTKAATDHIIFQNAQEYLSPGYLSNMRARSMKDYGQDWWWQPGEFTPQRPPDLERVTKQ